MLLMSVSVNHNDDGTLTLILKDANGEAYASVTGKPMARFRATEPFQQLYTYMWDLYDEHVGFRVEQYIEEILVDDDGA